MSNPSNVGEGSALTEKGTEAWGSEDPEADGVGDVVRETVVGEAGDGLRSGDGDGEGAGRVSTQSPYRFNSLLHFS